jgi:LmbE family N-acetylglucosaminyl deacetylase
MDKILFIGPHLDDIELSCMGTLLTHKENKDEIYYCVMSDCTNLKRNVTLPDEYYKVIKELKLDYHNNLHLPNTYLYTTEIRSRIRKALELIRDNFDIKYIYCPWKYDTNQDHQAVAEETFRVFREHSILQYEIPNSCPYFNPNYYVELSTKNVMFKTGMLKKFKSQKGLKYFDSDFIWSTMRFRGGQVGVDFAEAFKVWKIIRRDKNAINKS